MIYQISNKNNVARIPSRIETQGDYIDMVLNIFEFFLANNKQVNRYERYVPKLSDIVIQENRMFIFFSDSKYVSAYFPFNFEKTTPIFYCKKYPINLKTTSHLKSLNECISREEKIEDAFVSCNIGLVIEDEDFISEDDKNIMSILLKSEPGYVRYDYDPKHEHGNIHPLVHFDINYTSNCNWKIGLHDTITPSRFCRVFNKKEDREFFENGPLTKRDKYDVLSQIIASLPCAKRESELSADP